MWDKTNGIIRRTGVALASQTSCPIALGEAGVWNDSGTLKWRHTDGTDSVISLASGAPFFAAVTKTAVALAGSPVYDNGTDGVGATLTRGTNGAIGTVGGVALTSSHLGKLILVTEQASTFQNGLYLLTAVGSGSAKYVLTRVAGFDTADTIVDGAQVAVQQGTYADQIFEQTATVETVGTDAITFGLVSTAVTFAAVKSALAAANSSIGVNSQKITGLANGSDPTDAAAFGQILTSAAATTATNVAEARSGYVRYEAPIAPSANAGACALVTDVAVANGAQTVAAQPDYPRKLLLFITDGDSSISAGTLDLVGVGPSGEAVTESIALTGGTASKTSTKAYATITSATVANLAGATGADKIALGVDSALGLVGQKTPASSTFAVHKADVDNANETVGTVDATAGTIVPTTAPNGTRTFSFWYTFAVTTVQNSHTHTLA